VNAESARGFCFIAITFPQGLRNPKLLPLCYRIVSRKFCYEKIRKLGLEGADRTLEDESVNSGVECVPHLLNLAPENLWDADPKTSRLCFAIVMLS